MLYSRNRIQLWWIALGSRIEFRTTKLMASITHEEMLLSSLQFDFEQQACKCVEIKVVLPK